MKTSSFRVFADGALIADNVHAAIRFGQRLRGLIGHRRLDAGAGLLLDPGGSVHTFGMRFPIDVVFLDRHRYVLDARSIVLPNRMCWAPRRTRSTLELCAGACAQLNLRTGQQLSLEAVYRE